MASLCLLPAEVENFKKALKEKDLKIADLLNMTTEARTELFKKYVGENSAKAVNTLFEEKLVLKNRIQGLKNWASKVGQIGRYDPAMKAKLDQAISEYRARQQERIFSPKEHEAFLNDLVDIELGTHITKEEASNIFELTKKVEDLKKNFNETTQKWTSEKYRLEYGSAKVVMENYVNDLKGGEVSLPDMIKKRYYQAKETSKVNKSLAVYDLIQDTIKLIFNNSIALVASVDNSFAGRQGLKVLFTHPKVWLKGFKNSFVDFAKTIGGHETMDALMADIYSQPNYINGRYEAAKILPKSEEQFPASLPERIPYLGRIFKASEAAFKGSAIRMRTGLFDLVSNLAERNGVDVGNKGFVQDLGKLVNSLTGRGELGRAVDGLSLVFWSPRMLKANLDVLTAHGFGKGFETPFIRVQAAKNLFKIIGSIATILLIARAINKDSVEFDPRSADFGKIKIGDTRFDITGGAASLVTLAARILTLSTKSTTTRTVNPLNSGKFGEQTGWDVLTDFIAGKTTPFVGMGVDYLKGQNRNFEKPTVGDEIYSHFTPISLQNLINLKDNASADRVAGALVDFVGLNANSYKPKKPKAKKSKSSFK